MGRPVQWLGHGLLDPNFESRHEQELYVFSKTSRPAVGFTHRPIEWVPWALSTKVTESARKANLSPLYTNEAKNLWTYTSTPP
jgi:hypothetical protein